MSAGGKNPKGSGQIIQEGPGGDSDSIEDGGFDRSLRDEEVDK